MPTSDPLLGWDCVLAPRNLLAEREDAQGPGETSDRFIQNFPGRKGACYQMAPSLSFAFRQALQRKQISDDDISLYLSKIGSLNRFDDAFKKFYCFSKENGENPSSMSIDEVAAL